MENDSTRLKYCSANAIRVDVWLKCSHNKFSNVICRHTKILSASLLSRRRCNRIRFAELMPKTKTKTSKTSSSFLCAVWRSWVWSWETHWQWDVSWDVVSFYLNFRFPDPRGTTTTHTHTPHEMRVPDVGVSQLSYSHRFICLFWKHQKNGLTYLISELIGIGWRYLFLCNCELSTAVCVCARGLSTECVSLFIFFMQNELKTISVNQWIKHKNNVVALKN